ncbi:MAG: ABC transporter ATP-binding protein [Clostridia bacterium]
MNKVITIQNLTKVYGKNTVLHNVSLSLKEGRIYGLVGANGCGKTTLMRCICGFSKPTAGYVIVNGCLIGKSTLAKRGVTSNAMKPYERVADFAPSTGVIIEEPGFLSHETGLKNLLLLSNMSGKADKARAQEVMRLLGLDPKEKKPVGKYSLGQRQRLGFAQALMENPKVLILDEPFNALDQAAMQEVHGLLQQCKEQGNTILLASHSAADIQKACDVVYEMDNGSLKQIKGQ